MDRVYPANMRVICVAFLAATILLPEENGMADALLRVGRVADSEYVVPDRDRGAFDAIFLMNNRHSSCPNGRPSCKQVFGKHRRTPFKADCHATLIHKKFAITARNCFCHRGDDVAYTSNFKVWIGGKSHMVERTWVDHQCQFRCDSYGRHNPCDVAVIELKKPVRGVKPIRLYDTQKFGSEKGKSVTILGYGATGVAGRRCRHKQDGKLRRAVVHVSSLGPEGDTHGKNRNRVLRTRIRKKHTRVPQGMTSQGESGAPAFIFHRGKPFLAGVHAGRHRDRTSIRNPCSLAARDEFVRVSTTRRFLERVVTGKTPLKGVQTSMHRHARQLDMLPYRARGQGRFPWRHSAGHRRRHVSRSRVLKFGAKGEGNRFTGTQRCRVAAEKFLESMGHKLKQDICDNLPRSKWPLKFFRPGMRKAMQTIINHENMHVYRKGRTIRIRKGTRVSKTALSMWVHMQHQKYLHAAYKRFKKKAKRAYKGAKKGMAHLVTPNKKKRNAKHKARDKSAKGSQRRLTKKYYKMLLPLENRVKELKNKVKRMKKKSNGSSKKFGLSKSQARLLHGWRRRAPSKSVSNSFFHSFFPLRRRRSKFHLSKKLGSAYHRKHTFKKNRTKLDRRRRTARTQGTVWTNAGNPNQGKRGIKGSDYTFYSGGSMSRKEARETIVRRRRSYVSNREHVRVQEYHEEKDAEKKIWHSRRRQ